MTKTKTVAETSSTLKEETDHIYCDICYPTENKVIAFCGKDITDEPFLGEWGESGITHKDCVVCIEMEKGHKHKPWWKIW